MKLLFSFDYGPVDVQSKSSPLKQQVLQTYSTSKSQTGNQIRLINNLFICSLKVLFYQQQFWCCLIKI